MQASVMALGHRIRAIYDEKTIRVYQAYGVEIGNEVIECGHFGSKFSLERMTWIKPSFLWMMYRCGWGEKEGQSTIFAIDIKREGFYAIVEEAVLSSYSQELYGTHENWKYLLNKSKVRCQWDPDRDIYGNPMPYKAIQLGIKDEFISRYVNDWIVKMTDVTPVVMELREKKRHKRLEESMLPKESEYPYCVLTKQSIQLK